MSGRIVVGVDGSDASAAALRWAFVEARLRGATLEAVHAWGVPYVGDVGGMAAIAEQAPVFRQAAEHLVASAVDDVLGDEPGVEVVEMAVEGAPAHTLIEAASGADLLVVGSRGHGGFAGLLLGSVSQHCVRHAPCPVAVVRSGAGPDAAGDGGTRP